MALSQRLDLRQTQTLIMTPQLQQAIKLLQMSNQELTDFVTTEVEQNPLLERDDPNRDDFALPTDSQADGAPLMAVASSEPAPLSGNAAEMTSDTPGPTSDDDTWVHDGLSSDSAFSPGASASGRFDEDDEFSAAQNVTEKPSLRQHLMEQIQVDIHDPTDQIIAVSMVELLDEAGYLPPDLDLVRAQMGATPGRFESVIQKLQACDPPGIFARSLQECLTLQLRDRNRLDPAMQTLLQNLQLLARHEHKALMKLCEVDSEDLADMINEIKQLDPKPAQAFTSDVAPPIVPDVILKPLPGGGWHVELNTDTLPRVLANTRYYAQVQSTAHKKNDKEYLSERWQHANWLVKAIQQRATTILKVATEIVKQQDNFFVHGVQFLKPLILRDIAAAVEMHESTVSRVTQNKYIATPRGMFELKYFFTTALATSAHGISVSSESVRDRIRQLIDHEKPNAILSDDRLAELLGKEGIDIARRTVAKYREAMKIASSAQRRREKRVL